VVLCAWVMSNRAAPLSAPPQGPVSMSSEDVRQKYRDEEIRQRAWETCQVAIEEARILEEQQGVIVPVVLVDRHPMVALLLSLAERETTAVAKQVPMPAPLCSARPLPPRSHTPYLCSHRVSLHDAADRFLASLARAGVSRCRSRQLCFLRLLLCCCNSLQARQRAQLKAFSFDVRAVWLSGDLPLGASLRPACRLPSSCRVFWHVTPCRVFLRYRGTSAMAGTVRCARVSVPVPPWATRGARPAGSSRRRDDRGGVAPDTVRVPLPRHGRRLRHTCTCCARRFDVTFSDPLYPHLSLSLALSLSLSPTLPLSRSLSLSVSISISISLSLSHTLSRVWRSSLHPITRSRLLYISPSDR
jgi:hypothetical protein